MNRKRIHALALVVLGAAMMGGLWTALSDHIAFASCPSPLPTPFASPLLTVFMSALPHPGVEAGGLITYHVTVANEGSGDAHEVVVDDRLPCEAAFLETIFVSPLGLPAPLARSQRLAWRVGSLPRAGSASMAFTVRVSPEAATGLELVNALSATGRNAATARATVVHRVNEIQSQIDPEVGGELEAPIAGLAVGFPAGAVTETVQLSITIATTPTAECGKLEFAGRLFFLDAFDAHGSPVTSFLEPYTLTVRYEDNWWQQAGLRREDDLNLFYWDEKEWVPILPCEGCTLDTDANRLVAVLDHFTEFALGYQHWLYMPMVSRGGG